ncbi:MAG: hypothetical protein IPO92_16965 [Saprospiraceae bacterium]|nr:hypothetical protein [Saprospiraceae bacterium]
MMSKFPWSNGAIGVNNQVTDAGSMTVNISNGCNTINESFNIGTTDRAPAFFITQYSEFRAERQ